MNAIATYPAAMLGILGTLCLALVVVAAYVLVWAWALRLSSMRVPATVAFFGAVTLVWGIDTAGYNTMGHYDRQWQSVAVLSQLPLWPFVLGMVVLGVALLRLVRLLEAERRAQITPDSVKEAVDALPDGVCFSTVDGAPLLVNTQMDALAHEAFGEAVKDERELWERLCADDCLAGYASERVDADAGVALLLGPDGRAWQFSRRALRVDDIDVVETIAADVTEEHALVLQLEKHNRQMEEVNERLRAYGRDLTRLTREEEVLAAKVRVHDEIGRALVALRVYERQRPAERDRGALLDLWWRVAHLLEVAEAEEQVIDDWGLLVEAAAAVDVRLELRGALPEEPGMRRLAIMVIHECLNNAVRHGEAHHVVVNCWRDDDGYRLGATNDGCPPVGPAEESGGLSNVRMAVEREGGTLDIQWSPTVDVTAHLRAGA